MEQEKKRWVVGFYNESPKSSSTTDEFFVLVERSEEPDRDFIKTELADFKIYYKFWGVWEIEDEDDESQKNYDAVWRDNQVFELWREKWETKFKV